MSTKNSGSRARPSQSRTPSESGLAPLPSAAASTPSADAILHELQVHQIELEMQNETLRQSQASLEESRDSYVDLYDFAPVGYITVADTGLISEANLTAATLLGVERRALLRRRFASFVVSEERDKWQRLLLNALTLGGKQTYELNLRRGDGSVFPILLDCLPSTTGDSAPALRIAFTDISERKQLERALQDSRVELERAKAAAERANLAKSEFLSSMSHELRTPLNAVLGFAQLMAAGTPAPSPGQLQSIDQILKAGWHLLKLINDILDLAMIESGKVAMSQESVSLADVLKDCQAMIGPEARARGIEVLFPDLEDLLYVHADRTKLKQVIVNLLSNAIKYNRAGGTVLVQCAMGGKSRVRVGVTDTGAGLAPELLAQLFQPFNRLGQEAGAVEGTGIGLVVTKQLVELMGGVIGVDSSVGVGSVFWFELAASSAPERVFAGGPALAASARDPLPANELSQRTLLYVEDNPANLALIEELIARRSDLSLLSAVDGDEGIKMARAYQPDVVLMDINLPGISGIEAMKILRQDPATAHLPVLALSANAIPGDVEKAMSAGFFRYLTKPIKIDEFMDALDLALRCAAERRQATRLPLIAAGARQ